MRWTESDVQQISQKLFYYIVCLTTTKKWRYDKKFFHFASDEVQGRVDKSKWPPWRQEKWKWPTWRQNKKTKWAPWQHRERVKMATRLTLSRTCLGTSATAGIFDLSRQEHRLVNAALQPSIAPWNQWKWSHKLTHLNDKFNEIWKPSCISWRKPYYKFNHFTKESNCIDIIWRSIKLLMIFSSFDFPWFSIVGLTVSGRSTYFLDT